ncbi:GerW family sporulation protein [Tissierella sp. MB52-C2]|uniref:GerW family sporulation protein n=1 Tax=Tissierella sp. MB52-C2 TaxID=3070999 RepID=UPI00280B6D14|nr:GerW family sporulation protein [Tissierella sp. MB52-C2]WMM26489.1 GerW family sporulation protein [Tissierella sp. MB52-C2]
MPEHPIEGLMKTTMNNLKEMVDVNTIVGDAVHAADGSVIIPVSKISFGFASGGSEFNMGKNNPQEEKLPFGGGSGAGVSVSPVGFIVVGNEQIKLLTVDEGSSALTNLFGFVEKMADNLQQSFGNKNDTMSTQGSTNTTEMQ